MAGEAARQWLDVAVTVHEAIADAERVLPGTPAPEGCVDERWQAIVKVAEFIDNEPEAVWPFIVRWGVSTDEDLRAAIATCLLEHLLEYHFDQFWTRVEANALSTPLFGEMVSRCWKFGHAEESNRAKRFGRLVADIRRRSASKQTS